MIVRIPDYEVKSCPCCGCYELLDIGRQSSDTFGVMCRSCRLTMERRLPDRYPHGCDDLSDVFDWTTNQAIEAWNKRASPPVHLSDCVPSACADGCPVNRENIIEAARFLKSQDQL